MGDDALAILGLAPLELGIVTVVTLLAIRLLRK